MTTHPFMLNAGKRLALFAALFWIVGCQSGGAPAVASTTAAPTTHQGSVAQDSAARGDEAASSAKGQGVGKAVAPRAASSLTIAAASPKTANTSKAGMAAPAGARTPAAEKTDKKPNFKINTAAPTMNVGAKGAASVSISALNGYKWNKDYPAKLIFKAQPKNVELGKSGHGGGELDMGTAAAVAE